MLNDDFAFENAKAIGGRLPLTENGFTGAQLTNRRKGRQLIEHIFRQRAESLNGLKRLEELGHAAAWVGRIFSGRLALATASSEDTMLRRTSSRSALSRLIMPTRAPVSIAP